MLSNARREHLGALAHARRRARAGRQSLERVPVALRVALVGARNKARVQRLHAVVAQPVEAEARAGDET